MHQHFFLGSIVNRTQILAMVDQYIVLIARPLRHIFSDVLDPFSLALKTFVHNRYLNQTINQVMTQVLLQLTIQAMTGIVLCMVTVLINLFE